MGRLVHFVYGLRPQDGPFPLLHYLAIASALEVLDPDRIIVHTGEIPYGFYWDLIRPHIEVLRIAHIPGVDERSRADRFVAHYRYAHHADVVRLDVLLRHGGLYLDIDTLTIAPLPDDWWSAPFVIGAEPIRITLEDGREVASLLNAVMLSRPDSEFAKVWRDLIVESMDGSWSAHSCELAARLADEHPHAVRVLPCEAFARFPPSPAGLRALLVDPVADRVASAGSGGASDGASGRASGGGPGAPGLDGSFVLHLCEHLWGEEGRTDFVPSLSTHAIDERYVREGTTQYALAARRFLPDHRLFR